MFDAEKFADNWITELICDVQLVAQAYKDKEDSDRWDKPIEFAIELEAWKQRYRKVSQLCHAIGGDIVVKFTKLFPHGINEYKYKNKF